MLHPSSDLYVRLLAEIEQVPVVDCHEHMGGFECRPQGSEPIAALTAGYVMSDIQSSTHAVPPQEVAARLQDPNVATDAKWPFFEPLWCATEHTAYARVTKLILKDFYGVDGMSRESLDSVARVLEHYDEETYFRTIDEAGISVLLSDVLGDWFAPLATGLAGYLDGTRTYPEKWRLLISLPGLHPTSLSRERIEAIGGLVGRTPTSLSEFVDVVRIVIEKCKQRGAVGIKDQSAYSRVLAYDLVDGASAEKQFNRVLGDPRSVLGWPEGKALNDYLFHQYMRMARDLELPVQLHTGHMAGIRNRVDKANAVHLTPVFELHQEVRFDIFHGNWPYLGDLLFIGKNYPDLRGIGVAPEWDKWAYEVMAGCRW
jgi:hypothetical protein